MGLFFNSQFFYLMYCHFPMSKIYIKVAGAQTPSSRGKSPALSDSPGYPINYSVLKQILLTSFVGNVAKTVGRIFKLMSRLKGL